MHTSYSALSTFLTCPLKYKYQQIDKIKTPQSAEQAFGSLIHRTLKYAHTPASKGYPGKEEVINFFSQGWDSETFQKEEGERGFFEDGIGILSSYMDSLSEEEKKRSIALEHRFIVKVGGHTLGGAIDRIDRTGTGFEIIDYKTSRKIPPQKEIDKDLQLSIYLRAFIAQWPSLFDKLDSAENVRLSLSYLRHGLRLTTTRTKEDLKKIDAEILDIIRQVEEAVQKEQFDPRLNALCDWCDYQKICPLFRHKFKSSPYHEDTGQASGGNQESQEKEMQELGKKFILLKEKKRELEREISDLGAKLSGYLEKEKLGQFFTEKGSVLRQLRETYKYDAGAVAEMFNKWKRDPFSIMRVDAGALNKFAAGLTPEQRRELARSRKLEKQSYVLMVKKNK